MKFLLLSLLIFASTASAQVYKWTDSAGHLHFSDKPHKTEKAEIVTLKKHDFKSPTDKPPLDTDDVDDKPKDKKESGKKSATALQPVTMYATSWCGYCKMAREYFRKRNIPYTEFDIEKNEQAKAAYDAFGGKGVPVIFVGHERMDGFNAARFDLLYP